MDTMVKMNHELTLSSTKRLPSFAAAAVLFFILLVLQYPIYASFKLVMSGVAYAHSTPFSENQGTYRAIVIGNNNYKDPDNIWLPLNTAVEDAKEVALVLEQQYGFEDVRLLVNVTRLEIIDALNILINKLKEKDNVLIYYAGHGHLNEQTDEAYWVPVDAKGRNDAYFVSNARIKEKLSVISKRASHTLLVSDSCFSGSLLRGGNRGISRSLMNEPYLKKVAKRKSVQIVAAGGIQYVDDNYRDSGHSPFTYFFLNELKDNINELLTATELSSNVTRLVANAVNQTPQSGILQGAGDEGGEFIFKKVVTASFSTPKSIAPSPKTSIPATTIDPAFIEWSFWQEIKDSSSPELFNAYIKRYPNGTFIDIAKHKLSQLSGNDIDFIQQQAESYFEIDALITPPGNNARDQWMSILEKDPANKKARKGLQRITERLVEKALSEMKHNDYPTARNLLQEADKIQPGDPDIASAWSNLKNQEKKYNKARKERDTPPIPPPGF